MSPRAVFFGLTGFGVLLLAWTPGCEGTDHASADDDEVDASTDGLPDSDTGMTADDSTEEPSDDSETPGDSDTDSGTECDQTNFSVTASVDVIILLDRSWSMETGGLWDPAVDALQSIVGDLKPLINFGLGVFPGNPPLGMDVCADGTIEVELNGIAGGDDVVAWLGANDPEYGNTPTASALEAAADYLGASSPDGHTRFVLLVTDGAPNCNWSLDCACSDDCAAGGTCCTTNVNCPSSCASYHCLDRENVVTAATALAADDTLVYVIGVGPEVTTGWDFMMDEIAAAGGTTQHTPVQDVSTLHAELAEIAGALMNCEFDVAWDELSEDVDQGLVNFYGALGGNEELIYYDEGCVDGLGWDWFDTDTAVLCPGACARLKDGEWDRIVAKFGCATVPLE